MQACDAEMCEEARPQNHGRNETSDDQDMRQRSHGQSNANRLLEGHAADSRTRQQETVSLGRLVTLKDCGHFSYLECPVAVREQLDVFFHGKTRPARLQ